MQKSTLEVGVWANGELLPDVVETRGEFRDYGTVPDTFAGVACKESWGLEHRYCAIGSSSPRGGRGKPGLTSFLLHYITHKVSLIPARSQTLGP